MKILAIDPGLSGAVVLLGPGELQVRTDFKHIEDLTRAIDEFAPSASHAVVELVAARPGQGVSSMFTFGMSAGVALGSLHSNGFSAYDKRKKKLVEVAPQKWQRYFRELETELDKSFGDARLPFDSKAVARRLLSHSAEFLERAKDHNTADALLMALWYVCTAPELGSLRERDKMRMPWLQKRFNQPI
jgi:crossover junction endodeoxyribonuclease RuvC